MVTSNYGVTIQWNNVYNVRVTLGSHYMNRTIGLCGTYNENEDDDLRTSYGAIATSPVEFGNSWKIDPNCENATNVTNPCDISPERKLIAQANCSALHNAPFNVCASFINVAGYIADCEYDMCSCERDPVVCYCQALAAYADDCASSIRILWKNMDEFAVCGKSQPHYLSSCAHDSMVHVNWLLICPDSAELGWFYKRQSYGILKSESCL